MVSSVVYCLLLKMTKKSEEKASLKDSSSTTVHKASKIELVRVADNSKSKVTINHYLGICLWLGWFGFYAYLPLMILVLWFVSKAALAALIIFLIVAFLLPIDRDIQPKWCYALGANLMRLISYAWIGGHFGTKHDLTQESRGVFQIGGLL